MPPTTHIVSIDITEHANGDFETTATNPTNPPVMSGDKIRWEITKPDRFPGSAIFLRFFDRVGDRKRDSNGCMVGGDWRQGRGETAPGTSLINGNVARNKTGTHTYLVGYVDGSHDDQPLLDPEIIVEGNRAKEKKKAKKAKPANRAAKSTAKPKAKKTSKPKAKNAKPKAKTAKPKAKKR